MVICRALTNHAAVGQNGMMRMASPPVFDSLCSVLVTQLKGGKIYGRLNMFQECLNASVAHACGSGEKDMYVGSRAFVREANKSISGEQLKKTHITENIKGCNPHSVLSLNDRLS